MVSAVFDIGTVDIAIWVVYFIIVVGTMLMMYNLYDEKEKNK
jgi:hypothetical protein